MTDARRAELWELAERVGFVVNHAATNLAHTVRGPIQNPGATARDVPAYEADVARDTRELGAAIVQLAQVAETIRLELLTTRGLHGPDDPELSPSGVPYVDL